MNVSLVLMTAMIQEWLTVLTSLAVSVVLVRLATLAVEEMAHVKVIDLVNITTDVLKFLSYRH